MRSTASSVLLSEDGLAARSVLTATATSGLELLDREGAPPCSLSAAVGVSL